MRSGENPTMLDTLNTYLAWADRKGSRYFDPNMLLPTSEDTEENGRLVVSFTISDRETLFAIDQQREYLVRIWRNMYTELLTRIAKITIGRDEHFVIKFHPMTEYRGDTFMTKLMLSADVLVAQTKNVIIPTILWDNVDGNLIMREWRCGYCNSPNELKERHCTQCGGTRAQLIQELT